MSSSSGWYAAARFNRIQQMQGTVRSTIDSLRSVAVRSYLAIGSASSSSGRPALAIEQPQDRAENDAYDNAGRKRKIEMEVLPLDDDVTR